MRVRFGSGLTIGCDGDGRLAVAPASRRGGVRLAFAPDALVAAAPGCDPLALAWDDHGEVPWMMDRRTVDRWMVTFWASGRGGVAGTGIQVCGAQAPAAEALRRATTRWWERANASLERMLDGVALPVAKSTAIFAAGGAERCTLAALTTLLAQRPALRSRLDDRARMEALARDLVTGLLPDPPPHEPVRRDATDVAAAMQRAGLVHPLRRPVARVDMPEAEAVERTRAALAANPYREGRPVDEAALVDAVRRRWLLVQPWPFGALVRD